LSINEAYFAVKEFHKAFNHPYSDTPKLMELERAEKRRSWMDEEINEFINATKNEDIYEQVDALIDLIYFALGTLVEIGVPPEGIFKIVQNANMSKLWEDGKPRFRESDGKVIKPSNWEDPHNKIAEAINEMING